MKKRILSLILALCALVVLATGLSVTAFAVDTLTYKSPTQDVTYTYDTDTNTLTVTGTGIAQQDDVIAAKAAFENAGATFSPVHLVIGEDIEELYTDQFHNCTSLQSVTVCGDTSLGVSAFIDCTGLTSVTFLSDAKIAKDAFYGCTGLTSIVIPGKATIAITAFSGCTKLESITVGGDVRLGSSAFSSCSSLKNAYFFGGIFYMGSDPFKSVDHDLNVYIGTSTAKTDYERNFKNSYITVIPMSGSCGATENDNVTWRLSADGTMTISGTGDMANYSNDDQPWKAIKSMVKSVIVEDGVTKIGENAFNGCNVSSICGYTGTAAETYANSSDNNFSFVPLNGSCGASAGDNVTWTFDAATGTLTVSGSGKMADYSYSGGQPWAGIKDMIKKIVIEDGVTSIGEYAFYSYKHLTSVTFKGEIQNIGNDAFEYCSSLNDVTFAGSVGNIGMSAFDCCGALTSLVFPHDVECIGKYAFEFCYELKNVTFMGSVGSISYEAFYSCGELTDIFFAADVGSIGNDAFAYAKKLANVYCFGSLTFIDEDAFDDVYKIFNIYCYTDNLALQGAWTELGKVFIPLDGEDNGVVWRLAVDGTLTVRGDLSGLTAAPWKTLTDEDMIKNVVIYGSATNAADLFGGTYRTVTFKTDDTTDYATILVADGETIPTPADPTKAGYAFAGWHNGETKYDFTAAVTADLTLTAKWEKPDYVGTLESAQTALDKALKALQTAVDNNKTDIDEEIVNVNTAITNLQNELAAKASTSALDDLAARVTALKDVVDALNAAKDNYSTTDEMNTAISNAVNAAKAAQDTVIEELKTRLEAAEENIKNLTNGKADATQLKAAVDELKALIKALDDVKDAYKGADDTLKADLQAKIDSANDALKAAEKRIDALEAEMNTAKENIDKLTADLAKAQKDLNEAIDKKADAATLTAKVEELEAAIAAAKKAAQEYADGKDETLNRAIANAENTLKGLIDDVQKNLDKAVTDLNKAISDGDKNLADKITALNTALETAKTELEKADADNKTELNQAITNAENTLKGLIDDVQKNLDKAITDLNKAISDGDKDLSDKITALNTALETAKTTLEKADADNKTELNKAISDAQTALQAAIDKVASDLASAKAELEAKNSDQDAKDAELEAQNAKQQTFITVVCVIACISLAGNFAIVITAFILKRKRTH